jgi:hypothetical protein
VENALNMLVVFHQQEAGHDQSTSNRSATVARTWSTLNSPLLM